MKRTIKKLPKNILEEKWVPKKRCGDNHDILIDKEDNIYIVLEAHEGNPFFNGMRITKKGHINFFYWDHRELPEAKVKLLEGKVILENN